MNARDCWQTFLQSGSVVDYLNYKQSVSAAADDGEENENYDRRAGDMGAQNGGNGQSYNTADA
ncbi:MAG: hypothetical protein RR998_03015 [Oscillospiraceae bacterium]